jgi:ubiquitin-conjugating enzyme E2 G1
MSSALLLQKQLRELEKNPVAGFSAGLADTDIYEWDVIIMGPDETPYQGGFFRARITFPVEYPNQPPTMRFLSDMFHPNVHQDGKVCISILHSPGDDSFGYEQSEERWRPIHSVESIVMSVISMLSSPNDESPANLEAAVRSNNPEANEGRLSSIRKTVQASSQA